MEDNIRRAIDYVYFIHKANGTTVQRIEAIADVFDVVLDSLPRWTDLGMLSDAFVQACGRHADLQGGE